jgi:hypothetical protein
LQLYRICAARCNVYEPTPAPKAGSFRSISDSERLAPQTQ